MPYQAARDRVEERIAELVNEDRIAGISASRNESDLKEPVRLVLELKKDADPEVVLAQLYQFSPLQDTFSLIFLALVDGKPRVMGFKELLEEFIRHREIVIRRRTQFLLAKARQRKHCRGSAEGGLQAHQRCLVAGCGFVDGSVRLAQDAPDRVARQRQAAAHLAQAVTLRLQGAHRVTDLGRGHVRRLAGSR